MGLKCWFAIALLLMVNPVSYATDGERIKIVSQEWPGYTNGDGSGFYWEIVKSVYQPLDVPLTLEVLPWKRAKHVVRKQEASAYLGDYFYLNADAFLYHNGILVWKKMWLSYLLKAHLIGKRSSFHH